MSVAFCAALISGWNFFAVTTDPIELWSPVDSVTRVRKDYYDTHFRPFYRTTQLIVRPVDTTPWNYSLTFYADTPVQYSAALRFEFLSAVLALQNTIASLTSTIYCDSATSTSCSPNKHDKPNGVAIEVRLDDVCFQPLLPDNANCTIQSVLNYWQNSQDTLSLNTTDDFGLVSGTYITHFVIKN